MSNHTLEFYQEGCGMVSKPFLYFIFILGLSLLVECDIIKGRPKPKTYSPGI